MADTPMSDERLAELKNFKRAGYGDLIAEVERLRARVAELESKLDDKPYPSEWNELARLKTENAELSKDKARLDWLESVGFSTTHDTDRSGSVPGVHSWLDPIDGTNCFDRRWTARHIYSEYQSCREAIDAAREATHEQ